MAIAAAELPILSYGHTIARSSKYKYKKPMKIPKKQPTLPEKREDKEPSNSDGGALKKVGAFGVSVRKSQLPDYSKHEKTTVDRVTSPIKEVTEAEEQDNAITEAIRKLPGVEISLTKKIKRRIMLRHATNTDTLTSSDKQVLEDLRQGLRTGAKEHGGAKSVLEAMGDPKLREARFLYEPLKKFLAGTDRQSVDRTARKTPFLKSGNGSHLAAQGFPQNLRLVNTSVPPSQQHFNTPVDPRHLTSTSHLQKPSRGGSKHGFPTFPKMTSSGFQQVGTKDETQDSNRLRTSRTFPNPQNGYSLSPASGYKNESENGRRTDFSLPSISLYAQIEQLNQEDNGSKNRSPKKQSGSTADQEKNFKRKITNQQEHASKRAPRATRPRVGRPPLTATRGAVGHSQGVNMTATGKSHLIGPMNKMDMIVEYSKLLQSKVINYEQYIKKLSKLSLHKIDLGNSGLRHYHIVRDGTTGMKPRLARVDIYPSRAAPTEDQENVIPSYEKSDIRGATKQRHRDTAATNHERSTRQRTSTLGQSRGDVGTILTPYDVPTPYKSSQLRLSRVSIGEGIPESRYEHYNTGFDIVNGEYLTYDDIIRMQGREMDRYRDAHRPPNYNSDKRTYHWTHMPQSTTQVAVRRIDPSAELYAGSSGRLLQNSREIKKRLNFSYPSYGVTVDGTNTVQADSNAKLLTPYEGQEEADDSSHDPDYLAITLDQPREKVSFNERPQVTSSLSVHDVTVPTEVKIITGKVPPKPNNGAQRKGLVLGYKESTKLKEAGSDHLRGSMESLNLTAVAITNSNIVNSNPSSSRSPYYISQDDFVTSGTDGVLQNHLSTIYKSINRAKSKKSNREKEVSFQPGKNSPPDVMITRMSPAKNPTPPQQNLEITVAENAKLLLPGKRLAPPNTPPPKTMQREATEPTLEEKNLFVPSPIENVTAPHTSKSSDTSSSLLAVPTVITSGSPPPTAFLLKAREDEVTSLDESDDAINDFNDVITVNVPPINADET